MNTETKNKIKAMVLTALAVGGAAVLAYLSGLLKAYTG